MDGGATCHLSCDPTRSGDLLGFSRGQVLPDAQKLSELPFCYETAKKFNGVTEKWVRLLEPAHNFLGEERTSGVYAVM
jgi:hypothetical protein